MTEKQVQEMIGQLETIEAEALALRVSAETLAQRCYKIRSKLSAVSTVDSARKGLTLFDRAKLVNSHAKTFNNTKVS